MDFNYDEIAIGHVTSLCSSRIDWDASSKPTNVVGTINKSAEKQSNRLEMFEDIGYSIENKNSILYRLDYWNKVESTVMLPLVLQITMSQKETAQ